MPAQLAFSRISHFISQHKIATVGAAISLSGLILTLIGATNENSNAAAFSSSIGVSSLLVGLTLMICGRRGGPAPNVDDFYQTLSPPQSENGAYSFP